MNDDLEIKILRAFKPGDVVILRFTKPASLQRIKDTEARMKTIVETTGVKIVLLNDDLEVVPREDPP